MATEQPHEGLRRPLHRRSTRRPRPRVKTSALSPTISPRRPDEDKLWTIALFSGRRPSARSRRPSCANGRRSGPASRSGCSRKPIRSSAIWPKPSPWSCRPRRQIRQSRSTHWIEHLARPRSSSIDGGAQGRDPRRLGPARRDRAVPLQQAASPAAFASASASKLMTRALAQATGQDEAGAGAPTDGRLDAGQHDLPRADRGRGPAGGPLAALSVLPCLPARRPAGNARTSRGLAGGMEVGRHPRPADPARRANITSGRAARS